MSMTMPRRLAAAIALVLSPLSVCAATPAREADAQDVPQRGLPQAEPQLRAQAQDRFTLSGVDFNGNTRIPDARLQAMVAPHVGQQVTLNDLQGIATQVTTLYRQLGYFLAQAVVPVQEVRDGHVQISVVEGTLGNVDLQVAPDAPVSATRVQATLASLKAGKPLNGLQYERVMLLLSDLPGIRATSAVTTGVMSGTTDLTVHVDKGRPLAFMLEADNHGTPESGRARVGGTLRWNSPTGHGDNLDLRVLVAEDAHTTFGRLSYETPLGYQGVRLGAGLARVQYELGGAFRALDATGTADITDVSLTWPVVRQRGGNLFLRAGIDNKNLTDKYEAVGLDVDKHVRGASVGLSFESRDTLLGGGYTSLNGVIYRGTLDIRDPLTALIDQSPFGRRTEGSFTKLSLQATRLQRLTERFNLYLGTGLQQSGGNLDPSEQLSLGGPRAVRAYSTNEALVDQGWIANLELRYAATDAITPFVFYDAAHGQYDSHRNPLAVSNGTNLRGYGVGLSWSKPGSFSLNATVAWRDTARALADPRDPRLYVQFQKSF
jgi:hemolysin activation/secretion protein